MTTPTPTYQRGFKTGDWVQWTHVRQEGEDLLLSTAQGEIVGWCRGTAVVRLFEGEEVKVAAARLRPQGRC